MSWLEWLVAVAGLLGLFALWDLVFCGGRRCRWLTDRRAPGEREDPR